MAKGVPLNPDRVVISRDESRRFDRLVQRVGRKKAAILLGTSDTLIDAACEEGRMMRKTRDRLVAQLEVIERVA